MATTTPIKDAATKGLIERRYGQFLESAFPKHPESRLQGWIAGHQKLFNDLDEELLALIASHQVGHAQGVDLDFIGSYFGILGKRRGRGDANYRRYLKSIVDAYTGNGTRQGIRFAVSAVTLTDPESSVEITEDFQNQTYTLHISYWADHEAAQVRKSADISDPSGVRLEQVIYECGEQPITVAPTEAAEASVTHESSDGAINIAPSETASDPDADRGYGTMVYDGNHVFGE